MKKNYSKSKMIHIPFTFSNILILIIFTLLVSNLTNAQSKKAQFIDVSIGYGISVPFDNVNVTGSGFYAQAEYVFDIKKWFSVRPYAGLILTKSDQQSQSAYKASTKAFLFGGKARFTAPIKWVAPYLETGIGASVGAFETFTSTTNINNNGLQFHIPFSIGLEIGRKHNFDFAFTYYFHPSAEQFVGAIAIGVSIPLNNN